MGRGLLSWQELEEILLDVEVALNNRPLSYVEADELRPILTPNVLLYNQPNVMPELQHHQVEESILRKRARYLIKCKKAMWSRLDPVIFNDTPLEVVPYAKILGLTVSNNL